MKLKKWLFSAENQNMEENQNFETQLQSMLLERQKWFNGTELVRLLEQYRLLHTCVRNLYDALIKKSLLQEDPYRMDQRISDIVLPESTPFNEAEIPTVLGSRFSTYETMLDFICTYYRFSVEGLPITKVKKLMDFNGSFDWGDLSINHAKANTRNLAIVINKAKMNAQSVNLSLLTDSVDKSGKASNEIGKILGELGNFQKEFYKGLIRRDVIGNPDFNREEAYSSQEAEFAEIKRLFAKLLGKKQPFYSDLINEIVNEDQAPNKEQLQEKVLSKLQIVEKRTDSKSKKTVNTKELIVNTVQTMGAMAPILIQIRAKLVENFDLIFAEKQTFLAKLLSALKKALNIKPKERVCVVTFTEEKTGAKRTEKVFVNEFLTDIEKKIKAFNVIATKNADYDKIEGASEDAILSFVNKQLSEVQSLYTTINGFDAYFKNAVEGANKLKIKGLKIDLDSLKNAIITVNKKRGEYVSIREEAEQLKKLGVENL